MPNLLNFVIIWKERELYEKKDNFLLFKCENGTFLDQ